MNCESRRHTAQPNTGRILILPRLFPPFYRNVPGLRSCKLPAVHVVFARLSPSVQKIFKCLNLSKIMASTSSPIEFSTAKYSGLNSILVEIESHAGMSKEEKAKFLRTNSFLGFPGYVDASTAEGILNADVHSSMGYVTNSLWFPHNPTDQVVQGLAERLNGDLSDIFGGPFHLDCDAVYNQDSDLKGQMSSGVCCDWSPSLAVFLQLTPFNQQASNVVFFPGHAGARGGFIESKGRSITAIMPKINQGDIVVVDANIYYGFTQPTVPGPSGNLTWTTSSKSLTDLAQLYDRDPAFPLAKH